LKFEATKKIMKKMDKNLNSAKFELQDGYRQMIFLAKRICE